MMTTSDSSNREAATWAALSDNAQLLLRKFTNAEYVIPLMFSDFSFSDYEELYDRDLILAIGSCSEWSHTKYKLRDADRALLASANAKPTAEAGDAHETVINELLSSKDLPLDWIKSCREHTTWMTKEGMLKNDILDLADLAEALQARLATVEAENAALTAALQPFADVWHVFKKEQYRPIYDTSGLSWDNWIRAVVQDDDVKGHYERAAALRPATANEKAG